MPSVVKAEGTPFLQRSRPSGSGKSSAPASSPTHARQFGRERRLPRRVSPTSRPHSLPDGKDNEKEYASAEVGTANRQRPPAAGAREPTVEWKPPARQRRHRSSQRDTRSPYRDR